MLDRATRRKYLSEAFHALAQPITGLQCGLEIAIAKPRSAADYKKRIGDALEITSRFRDLAVALRELVEADDVGDEMEDVQLSDLFPFIHEAVSEIATLQEVSLIFESATKVRVRIDKERFLRTVALLAEQMLVKKGQLRFDSRRMNRSIEIICEGQWQDERAMANSVVEIRLFAAENYIEALGGNLTISQNGCRIELPCEAAAGT